MMMIEETDRLPNLNEMIEETDKLVKESGNQFQSNVNIAYDTAKTLTRGKYRAKQELQDAG